MTDFGDTMKANAIRMVVSIVILCIGVYMTRVLRERRRNDHLWLLALFFTLLASVGMFFTLEGTTRVFDKPVKNAQNDGFIGNVVFPDVSEGLYDRLLWAGHKKLERRKLSGVEDVFEVHIPRLERRICFLIFCSEIPKPKLPEKTFAQRNKSRLITTGSTTAAGSGGTYANRRRHKYAWLIGLLLVIAIGVGLWFAVGEDD